jgi:hypothetical protein
VARRLDFGRGESGFDTTALMKSGALPGVTGQRTICAD